MDIEMVRECTQEMIGTNLDWMVRLNQPYAAARTAPELKLINLEITHRLILTLTLGEHTWRLITASDHGLFGWRLAKLVEHVDVRGPEWCAYFSGRNSFHLLDAAWEGLKRLREEGERQVRAEIVLEQQAKKALMQSALMDIAGIDWDNSKPGESPDMMIRYLVSRAKTGLGQDND